MNIFVLDENPKKCAQYHCDKHVIKMILESAQMICTTHHLHPNKKMTYDIPYKLTHTNHPCNRWLRDSMSNYLWLVQLVKELNEEYKYRYDKDKNHKSYDAVKNLPLPDLPNTAMTKWARAMPEECKIGKNIIESYRNYYIKEKKDILTFKKREKPYWISINNSL